MPEPSIFVQEEIAANLRQTERRSGERQPCKRRPAIRLLTRPGFQARTAIIVDASACGLGLLLQERLETGTVLALQLRGKHTGLSRILSARVLSASPQADGNWYIDCALSGLFSDEELQSLLWEGP